MRTRPQTLLALLVLVIAASCVSLKRTPEARFFVLRSLVEPPAAPAAEPTGGIVGVAAVQLPGHLERSQVVAWRAPGELRVDEFVRWGEPLDTGIARTLRENLAVLLPEHRLIGSPWRADTKMRCRVVVELSVFGRQGDGDVLLRGRWTLLPARSERALAIRPVELRRGPVPSGPPGTEAGASIEVMSQLIADLSRQIADGIRALPSEPPAEAPPPREPEDADAPPRES